MTELLIRPLRPEDRPRWQRLWSGYLDFYRSELSDAVTDDVFARLVGPDPTMEGLVAIHEGSDTDTMVGLAHTIVHPNTWSSQTDTYLEDLFVDPGVRGTGIGEALIEAVAARGRARGDRRVHWLTEHDNDRARRLYDRVAELSGYVRYVRDLPTPAPDPLFATAAIGVFCASAIGLDATWHEAAATVGTMIGEAGHRLVYGGTNSGTMATLATSAAAAGAHVTGVTLQQFVDERFDHTSCDELVVTTDLHGRKREILLRSSGFIALPGGPGTLDEVGEVLAAGRLGLHDKPLVIANHAGFWTPLLASFELMAHTGFLGVGGAGHQVAERAEDAVPMVEAAWLEAAEARAAAVSATGGRP